MPPRPTPRGERKDAKDTKSREVIITAENFLSFVCRETTTNSNLPFLETRSLAEFGRITDLRLLFSDNWDAWAGLSRLSGLSGLYRRSRRLVYLAPFIRGSHGAKANKGEFFHLGQSNI